MGEKQASLSALSSNVVIGQAGKRDQKQVTAVARQHSGLNKASMLTLKSQATTLALVLADKVEQDFWRVLTQRVLNAKYLTSQEYYNSKIAADIMYNEQRHIVSVFKEYLIFDDFSEYLKRFYALKEAHDRLPRVFEFYEHYSKVFPNYVSIPESKYMFKNIERKQKLIDQRHQIFLKNQAKETGKADDSQLRHSANMLFGSQFLREVYADDTSRLSECFAAETDLKGMAASVF